LEKYIFLGGGGFATELYEYMLSDGLDVKGYYSRENNFELSKYIPWLGNIHIVSDWELDRNAKYIIAVRSIIYRKRMIDIIEKKRLLAGSYISQKAYLSRLARLGKGAVVFPNAIIGGDAIVGEYLFMDIFAAISHGDVIGNNVVLGPAVILSGDSEIGDDVTFGTQSAVLPGSKVGNNVEIAINTYPRKRVRDNTLVSSMPGKKFKMEMDVF